jgi:hypothetical protein
VSFTADVGQPVRSSIDVEGDRLTALTEQQMSIRATPCVGYWAAYYVNRDGGWSVACDALGRIIQCETEELALSVARYRRRRLQPLREVPTELKGKTTGIASVTTFFFHGNSRIRPSFDRLGGTANLTGELCATSRSLRRPANSLDRHQQWPSGVVWPGL